MMDGIRRHAPGLLAIADAIALWTLRTEPARAAAGLGHPARWFAADGPDRGVATLAGAGLWLTAAWLGLGLACCAAARIPGVIGAVASRAGRVLLPRVLLTLVAGSAGLGVLAAPVAAGAQTPPRPVPSATAAPTVPGPVWPSESRAAPVPGPRWPSTPPPPVNHAAEPAPESRPAETVRVRPGDSLWLIAARRLGPAADPDRIAAEWPRWYAANRSVIGPDPDVIRPGQVLHEPAASSQEAP